MKKTIKVASIKPVIAKQPVDAKSRAKYKAVRQVLLTQRRALLREAGISLPEQQNQIISPDTTDQAQAEMDVLAARSKQQFPAENKDVGAILYRLSDGVSQQAKLLLRLAMFRAFVRLPHRPIHRRH